MKLMNKIIPRRDVSDFLPGAARPLVFTNGVFDLLHPGHVIYLEQARLLGATLIVGVNSDSSVRRLKKGAGRPINAESDRLIMLAALESVSLLTVFDEDTPVQLVSEIRPDIYVKGGDYDLSDLEEAILVRSWGGEAKALQFLPGYSTTALVDRIRSLSL
jgi:rfaE bifunctional protein nucleotidyltransferase chain/domain